MAKIPTVTINTANGPVLINQKDYDATKHELLSSTTAAPVENVTPFNPVDPIEPQTPPAPPVIAPVENVTPPVVDATVTPPVDKIDAANVKIEKKGKKYFVLTKEGEPLEHVNIDPAGYASDGDAWAAILKQ